MYMYVHTSRAERKFGPLEDFEFKYSWAGNKAAASWPATPPGLRGISVRSKISSQNKPERVGGAVLRGCPLPVACRQAGFRAPGDLHHTLAQTCRSDRPGQRMC